MSWYPISAQYRLLRWIKCRRSISPRGSIKLFLLLILFLHKFGYWNQYQEVKNGIGTSLNNTSSAGSSYTFLTEFMRNTLWLKVQTGNDFFPVEMFLLQEMEAKASLQTEENTENWLCEQRAKQREKMKRPTLRLEKLPMKERPVRLLLLGFASSAVSVPSSLLPWEQRRNLFC